MSTENPNLLRSEIHGTFDTGILGNGTLESRITGLSPVYPTGQRQNDHMYSHMIQELNKKLDTFDLTGNIVRPVDAGFRPLNITGFFTPSGPSYSARALNYFNRVEAAGGSFNLTAFDSQYTEAYVKNAHNTLFTGLEAYASSIGQLVLNVGKTFSGLTVPAIGYPMEATNLVASSYTPVNTGSTSLAQAGLTAVNNSAFLRLANNSDNTGVLPVSFKDSYSLATVTTATTSTYSNAIEYYQQSASAGYIAAQVRYDSIRFYYGASFTNNISYNPGFSDYDRITDYWGYTKSSSNVGVLFQAGNSPVVINTSLNTSTYNASGSADGGVDWTFVRGAGNEKFPVCMVYKSNSLPTAVRHQIKSFLEAFGDTTITS